MADDREIPDRGYTTQDLKAVRAAEQPRKRHWLLWLFGIVVVVPALLLALWTLVTTKYVFSRGDRVGYVQKFSQRGLVCKTWEGELAMSTVPGSMPQLFDFTVRDDAVAQQLRKLMETQDGRVALTYEQHKKVPLSCFGDTEYYVVSVRPVGGTAPGVPASGAPAAPTTPTTTPATPTTPAAPSPR